MEATIISNNFPKEQQKQLNYPCKVRFQSLHSNNINGIIAQPLPKIDSLPQTRWRRFGSLKLISNKNKEQNQQQIRPLAAMSAISLRQQQSVRRLLTTTEEEDEDDDDDDDDEDETSSNSVPLNNTKTASNGFDGRKNLMQGERGKEEKMSSAGFHSSQSGNSAKALFLAMHQNRSKSSTTSPNVLTNNDHKRRRKSKESASGSIGSFHSKLCFFGILRIETGARLFLFFYIALSACGVIMGSVATMVWVLVPLVVVPLAAYSLSRHTSKCLYPFLVVSVIHSLVSFGMTIIVGCFSLLCFDQLKEHFALTSSQSMPHSSSNSPSLQHFTSSLHSDPILPFFASSNSTSMTALFYCALTMILSLVLAIFFFWQSTVLFSCISHFDILSQQRKQHEQQLKQSTAIGLESRVHSLASATADFKGTQTAIGTLSHPMECSQCISEIRQLDQFCELRASFRQC